MRYLACVFDVCFLSEKAGIKITAGIKLHCREKSTTVGRKAPLSGEKLARREQNSPDGNKTRQQLSQSQCKNGLVVEDKAGCVRCVTLLVCLTCVSCSKWQGFKSPREKSSTVGRKARTSGTKLARRTGTKLASSDPNPPARMDWLSRIRRGVYGALPYMCV